MDQDPVKGLYDYLKSKGKLGDIDETSFRSKVSTEDGLKRLHGFMVSNGLTDDPEDVFVSGHLNVAEVAEAPIPEKKNLSGPEYGTSLPSDKEPVVPSPVAPQRREEYLATSKPEPIPSLPGQAPIIPAGVRSNPSLSDFGLKGAEQASDELRNARQRRRQVSPYPGVRVAETAVEATPSEEVKNTPLSEQPLFKQGGALLAATGKEVLANVAETPEYLRDVVASVQTDIASGPLRKKLKSGEISQEEYDATTETMRTVFKDAVAPGTAMAATKFLEDVSDEFGGLDKWADRQRANAKLVRSKLENADETFESLIKQGEVGSAFRKAGIEAIGSLPYMMMSMIPGAGLPAVGLSAAKGKYDQLEEQGYEMGTKEVVNSILTGAFEGITEAVSAKIGKEALKLAARYGRDVAVKGVRAAIVHTLGRIGGNALEEGGSEALSQLAENIVDKATVDSKRNIFDGVLDAAVIGALSGGGVTAAGSAAGAVPEAGKALAKGMMGEDVEAPVQTTGAEAVAPSEEQVAPTREYSQEARNIASKINVLDTDTKEDIELAYDAYLDKTQEEFGQESPEYAQALTRGEEVVNLLAEENRQKSEMADAVAKVEYLDELLTSKDLTPEARATLEQERKVAEDRIISNSSPAQLDLGYGVAVQDVRKIDPARVQADPILSSARAVADALSGIGISVLLADTSNEAALRSELGNEVAEAVKAGRAIYVSGKNTKAIVLNLRAADNTSAVHEGFHAIIEHAATQRPEQINSLVGQIRPHINQLAKIRRISDGKEVSVRQYLDDFMTQYADNPDIQSEEFLSELGAVVSAGLAEVKDKTTLGRIEKAINDFIAAIIGEGKLVIRLTSSGDAVDLFNTMQRGLVSGDKLAVQRAVNAFGRAAKGKRGVFVNRSTQRRKISSDTVTVDTADGRVEIKRQRGVIDITEKEAIKYAKVGIVDAYSQQAIKNIGLTGVRFTGEAITERIQKAFDDIASKYEDYLVSKDSAAITKEIEQEIAALEFQGVPEAQMKELRRTASTEAHRMERVNNYRATQKEEAGKWVSYLKGSDYPVAFKYLVLDAVLTNNYDFATDKYSKRTNTTLRGITPFDAGSLAVLYASGSKELLKYYSVIQAENAKNIADTMSMLSTDEGKWIKFSGEGDAPALSQLVQNTPWCTKTLASSQLKGGDFYVFATDGTNGNPIPRIAVRMEGDRVGEVRGVKSEKQDLEDSMLPVANKFLTENIPNDSGIMWIESNRYNQRAIDLEREIDESGLTPDRLKEALELFYTEDQFNVDYGGNNNTQKLRDRVDYHMRYYGGNEWIAKSPLEINDGTKALMYDRDISTMYLLDQQEQIEFVKKLAKLDVISVKGGIRLIETFGIEFHADTIFTDANARSHMNEMPKGVKRFYGNLTLRSDDPPAYLTHVYGDLRLDSEDTGSIEYIGGGLAISNSSFNELINVKEIKGDIRNMDDTGSVNIVSFGSLEKIGSLRIGRRYGILVNTLSGIKSIGKLDIENDAGIAEIDGPESIGELFVSPMSGLESLGTLKRVTGDLTIEGNQYGYITFAGLEHVGGSMKIYQARYDTGSLKRVSGDVSISAAEWSDSNILGAVEYIGGNLIVYSGEMSDEGKYTYIDIPYIGDKVTININDSNVEMTTDRINNLIVSSLGERGTIKVSSKRIEGELRVGEWLNPMTSKLDISGVESVGSFGGHYFKGIYPKYKVDEHFRLDRKEQRYARYKPDDIRQQKQTNYATEKIQEVQPEGDRVQRQRTQAVREEAPAQTDTGNRTEVGGMPEEGVDIRMQKKIDPTEKLASEPSSFDLSDFEAKSVSRMKTYHEESKKRLLPLFDQHPVSLQTDELSSLERAGKAFVAFEKGASIGNTAKVETALSGNARPLYEMVSRIAEKISGLKDGTISREDVMRGALIASLEKEHVPVYDVLGVTGAIDDVFVSVVDGQQVVRIEDALSLLANTPGGMDGEGAKELLFLYDNAAENRVQQIKLTLDTYTEISDGYAALKKMPEIKSSGKSIESAIVGLGRVGRDSLPHKVATGSTPRPGVDYEVTPLSSRASMVAQAAGQKTPVVEAIFSSIWYEIPPASRDDAFFELAQNEFGFELQLMAIKDGDTGLDIRQQKASPALRAYPNYKAARKYVRQNYDRIPDLDIVQNLKATFGMFESDAKELLELVSGRSYRAPGSPMAGAVEDTNRFWRRMGKLLGDNQVKNKRDFAYSFDFRFGNFLAPLRKFQREIEKRTGVLMPAVMNAYDAMQLYSSSSLHELQKHTLWFWGDNGSESSKSKSFVGRITKELGGINVFNEFLIALHLPERLLRKLDLLEKYQKDIYSDIEKMLGSPSSGTAIQLATSQASMNPAMARLVNKYNDIQQRIADMNAAYIAALDRQAEFLSRITNNPIPVIQPGQPLPTNPELDKFMRFYEEYRDKLLTPYLDALMAAGRIDQTRYDHLVRGTSEESDIQWRYYVPMMYSEDAFNHELGITNGERIVNLNGIEGLSKPYDQKTRQKLVNMQAEDVVRPLELAFSRLASAIRQKHRQDALRRFAELVRQHGDVDRIRVFASRNVPKMDKYGNITGAQSLLPKEILENSVPFYEGGKVKYIYFSNPGDQMLSMLRSPDIESDMGAFMKFYSAVLGVMRIGITSLSPTFILNNFLRDIQESSVNIRVENDLLQINNNKLRKAWKKRWREAAAQQIVPFLASKRVHTDMDRYYAEYLQLGASMSWNFDSSGIFADMAGSVNQRIRDAERVAASGSRVDLATSKNRIIEMAMGLSARFENVSRLASYAALRDLGVDPIRAAAIAKNITINFEKKGQFFRTGTGRFIAGMYLFLNAGLQSGRKMIKQLSNPSGRRMLALYGMGSIAFRMMLHAMYPMLGDDDKDEKESQQHGIDRYMNSAFTRQFYMAVPNPFDVDDPLLLPRPYGAIRVVGIISDGVVDVSLGKRSILSATSDAKNAFFSSLDPVGFVSGEITNAVPTLMRPFAEVVVNRDWMGRQILFSREDSRMYAQANKRTLQAYKDFTPLLYSATGISVSPTHLEHIVESYTRTLYPLKATYGWVKSYDDFAKASEKSKGDDTFAEWMWDQGRVNMIVYKPNLSQNDRQDLYNFMAMTDIGAKVPLVEAGWTEKELDYLAKAAKVIRREKLLRDQDINSQIVNVALEMKRSGQLDRKTSDGKTYRQKLLLLVSSGGRDNFKKKLADKTEEQ